MMAEEAVRSIRGQLKRAHGTPFSVGLAILSKAGGLPATLSGITPMHYEHF